ncbi:MAG: energy transducer TonB [Sphingobium sp.]|nr:hypothetical protein SPH9361_00021 [Sphingobium sp. CECT 9361]
MASSRVAPFLLSLAFHLAIMGLFLTIWSPAGDGRRSLLDGARDNVLTVTLIPLDSQRARASSGRTEPLPSMTANARNAIRAMPLSSASAAPSGGSDGGPSAPIAEHAPEAQAPGEANPIMAPRYRDMLLAHIAQFRRYPEEARRNRQQGTVLVRFLLDREGHVLRLWTDSSSGQPLLDDEAAAAVRRAQPLPPIPEDLPDRIVITIPINFELG